MPCNLFSSSSASLSRARFFEAVFPFFGDKSISSSKEGCGSMHTLGSLSAMLEKRKACLASLSGDLSRRMAPVSTPRCLERVCGNVAIVLQQCSIAVRHCSSSSRKKLVEQGSRRVRLFDRVIVRPRVSHASSRQGLATVNWSAFAINIIYMPVYVDTTSNLRMKHTRKRRKAYRRRRRGL